MFEIHRVESLEGPSLYPYRTMRMVKEHCRQGIFVAEGEKVVRRMLESAVGAVSVLVPERWLEEYRPLLEARPERIDVFIAEKKLLEQMTGFTFYQGVLGVGKVPANAAVDSLVAGKENGLFAAADSLSNAQNLGSLVRNAAAFGVDGLIVGETSCSPYLRRAVRASMGTIFKVPVHSADNLVASLDALRASGVRSVAAHPHTDRRVASRADFSGPTCIVFGSEGYGISPAVLERCDDWVAIPMADGVDSMNVASAAAVFFYEANWQRGRA